MAFFKSNKSILIKFEQIHKGLLHPGRFVTLFNGEGVGAKMLGCGNRRLFKSIYCRRRGQCRRRRRGRGKGKGKRGWTRDVGVVFLIDTGCIFCDLPSERFVDENELAIAIRDGFPVTEHHTLIIPKRHVSDYFDLYQPERNAIQQLLERQRSKILELDATVTGFNIGNNIGEDAGQTIFHCHTHLIPRRPRDVENPRGGVRGVIPSKQEY